MRLTVNLDEESEQWLDSLSESDDVSSSQVVREAIRHYGRLREEWDGIDEEQLLWYVRLLGGREHLIIDVDHLNVLFSEIGEFDESLIDEFRRIGQQHGIEWEGQFTELEEKLRVLEYCNWYTITNVAEGEYILTVDDEQSAKLVASFLAGECSELGFTLDIQALGRKVIISQDVGVGQSTSEIHR